MSYELAPDAFSELIIQHSELSKAFFETFRRFLEIL